MQIYMLMLLLEYTWLSNNRRDKMELVGDLVYAQFVIKHWSRTWTASFKYTPN